MAYEASIATIRDALDHVSAEVDAWFDRPEAVRRYRPSNGGWCIEQILDQISLTSHFLLLTCEKHVRIAQHRAQRGDVIADNESDLIRIAAIGERGSFRWIRPEHMEPTGTRALSEVRAEISTQWLRCRGILDSLQEGQGALCHVTMSVNAIGKIDLYQWLYFVVLHARRHVQQMRAIEEEYAQS